MTQGNKNWKKKNEVNGTKHQHEECMHKGNWCHSFKCLLITQCRPILTLFLWRTLINVLTERRVRCGGQLKTGAHSGQRGGAAFQKSWSKVWPVADASRPARQGFNNLSEAFFLTLVKSFLIYLVSHYSVQISQFITSF